MSPNGSDHDDGRDEAMFDDGRFCGDDGPPVKRVVLEQVPAHVNRINVDGLARTKDDIVTKVCHDVFKAENFAGNILKPYVLSKDDVDCGIVILNKCYNDQVMQELQCPLVALLSSFE